MNTQALIRNIEDLSATLNQKQLIAFLDIMDALAAMTAEAQQLAKQPNVPSLTSATPVTGGMH
ncbi:hypothetical protein [Neptunicella marina]|uniref:Uncharacterized protein n=1 Tax=Neptunicella marina TaxID=2125989 RepID=A0A8J6LX92_9ALTE|nr:hypothetical protein [Neptunicella marina]MBC3765504.1 hypothetical protein [Neptunicella marina]